MAVLAPDAPKATTLNGEDIVYAGVADIVKSEEGPDGSLYVYGKATTPEVDTDEQVVKPEWSGPALKSWMDEAPALRVMHNATAMPAGSGVKVEVNRDGDGAHWIKGVVDEPTAQMMVRKGHLRAFSVGIARPVIERDMSGKARGGIITGGRIVEVSLVDSPANRSCWLEMVKADKSGQAEFTGTLTAPDDILAKYAAPSITKDSGLTTVDLPSDMKLKVTPATLAKMATLKRDLVLQEQALRTAAPDVAKGRLKDSEREGMPAGDFAYIDSEGGKHLPVHDAGHVHSALGRFAQQHFESGTARKKAARKIVSRARSMGIDLADHGMVVQAAGGKASKAAEPDITKCGTCNGEGEMDGKPCPDCKGKAAAPDTEKKKKGKLRAICPNCGAKQNPDHNNCPECGHALPARPAMAVKNHDFACLGCGNDLDKGEKFCPGCGKANPGHNPMADLKIPANKAADASAGKDRVAKAKKKSGKGKMPFGGNQAKPFGAKDGPDEKEAAKSAVVKRKGKGKGRSPAAGVRGHETTGLPPHREPDGAPVEQFENDAALQDGDQQMKAAMRHKSLGIEPHLAVLHDLTCPAFSPASVDKCLPHASFAGIDTQWWASQALKAAAGSDMTTALADYNAAQALSRAAVTLKTADPQVLHRIRLASHEAFLEANKDVIKTFRDATPGPGSAPTPGHVMPGSFRRPYISAGHAAESPQAEGARTFPVITGHPQAQDFTRGYISAGHASEAPANSHMGSPVSQGAPGAVHSAASDAAGMQARDYEQATSAMHDHLSRIAPGMCPMSPPMGSTQKPAPQVPDPVGMIEPHKAKASKAEKAAQRARRKARAAQKAAKSARRKARAQRRRMALKAAGVTTPVLPVPGDVPVTPATLDAGAITAAVKAATAPLAKRIAAQDKALRRNQKVLDAIAGQPDTSRAPFRGAGVYKASAAPAAPQTAAEAAALAQTSHIQRLNKQWRDSYNPAEREAAWQELTAQLGINPMTGAPDTTHPFRT